MIPLQCRLGRTALGWGVRDLAREAKVSPSTVAIFERGDALQPRTVDKLRAALVKGGAEFIDENGGGPGVRLAKPAKAKAKRKGKKR